MQDVGTNAPTTTPNLFQKNVRESTKQKIQPNSWKVDQFPHLITGHGSIPMVTVILVAAFR